MLRGTTVHVTATNTTVAIAAAAAADVQGPPPYRYYGPHTSHGRSRGQGASSAQQRHQRQAGLAASVRKKNGWNMQFVNSKKALSTRLYRISDGSLG